ncbi:MAG: hypothetical protein ACR2OA_03045 [Rubripirellula sp.]
MLTITDSRAFLVIALLASMTSLANAQDELAKSPQELLQRLDKSVKSKDLSRLQTCIPRQVDDKSKAAAAVVAKRIMLGKGFAEFGTAVQTKYSDRLIKILGVNGYFAMMGTGAVQSRMFESLAKQAEIEINENENTALAKSGEKGQLGAMELKLIRKNKNWFLEVDLGRLPDGTFSVFAEYEAAKQLLQSCNEALEQTANQQDLQSQFLKAIKKYQADLAPDEQK